MNEIFNLLPWIDAWVQNGLVLCGQTTLLLGIGLLALRFLQERQPAARDVLGRALLVSTLAGVALSVGLSLSSWSLPPALWNVSLPAVPVVLSDTSTASLSASPRTQFSSPDSQLRNPAKDSAVEAEAAEEKVRDKRSASSPARKELLPPARVESTTRSAPQAFQRAATPQVSGWRSLLSLLVGLWFGGATGLILWWGLCHEALRRLRRGAHPEEDAAILATLSEVCAATKIQAPLLLRHSKVSSPFLMGLSKPAILLPSSGAPLDPQILRAIFSHEAMHLKRRDLAWNALGRVGCALLWPQPLLWMLCRQIEQCSEEACDQAVLASSCPRQQYAKCLLDFAERLSPRRTESVAGIGVLTGKSSLSRRIQTILNSSQTRAQQISRRGHRLIMVGTLTSSAAMPLLFSGSAAPQKSAPVAPKTAVAGGRRMLQQFKQIGDYEIGLGGVENGVLQGIFIRQQRGGVIRQMIIARTARRQANSTRWILSEGITYGFSEEKGLISEARFKEFVPGDSVVSSYLTEQSQAASQPLSASEKRRLEHSLELPVGDLAKVAAWATKQPRVAISGRVLDEDKRPIAGAKVVAQIDYTTKQRILGEDGPSLMSYSFALPKGVRNLLFQVVTSGADGTYRIGALAPVRYELRTAESQGFRRIEGKVRAEAAKPPAQVLKAIVRVLPRAGQITLAPDLELTRGGLLRVRVLDKISGAPLPDVMLFGSIKGRPGLNVPTTTLQTDAKGEALFRLPEGRVNVALGGQKAPGGRGFAANSNGTYYAIDDGNELSLDDAPAQRIRGSAFLEILPNRTLEAVLRLARFVAPIPKPTPAAFPLMPPPQGTASLLGRVVDETGRAVAGVEVRAIIQQKAQWKFMQGAGLAYSNSDTPGFDKKWASIEPVLSQSALSRADGSFRLDGLTSAPYNLVIASKADFGLKPPADWVANAVEGVWAKEGQQTRRAAPIVLTRGALIVGRVVDKATGLGLGGVVFGANGPQLPTSTDDVIGVTSDKKGRFSLRVAPGVTSLYIAGPNQYATDEDIVYADTRKPGNAYRIGTSRGLYAGSDGVEFELDGGSPQFGLNLKSRSEGQIKIPTQKGQTRQITLRLRRLISNSEAKN